MPNERFKTIEPMGASAIVMDEPKDFNPDSLCLECNHLRYFKHVIGVYQANDENEPDLMVWKCEEEKCDCISVYPIIPETT